MGYAVLEIQLERFHMSFCLTLKAIQLATRYWETKMHRGFNTCPYFFIALPFSLQHKFLGEGCRACLGFRNAHLKHVVKVLYGLSTRLICVCCVIYSSVASSKRADLMGLKMEVNSYMGKTLTTSVYCLLPALRLNSCLLGMLSARWSEC